LAVERQQLILQHELAHAGAHDCASRVATQLLCALLWFQSLAWIARRALYDEQERAYDDRVLVAGGRPSQYLVGVSGGDPGSFAIVMAALVASAVLAAVVPLRRASSVDPVVAFRDH
jgi:Zn-dependent protease with chaperone function